MHILMRFSLLHADTLACQAVYQREGLRPEMLSQLGGDNTDHALQQRGRTAEFLAALSGLAGQIVFWRRQLLGLGLIE